ncbi:MAG: thiamine-monophosphate kinase, partial [Chitinophagaceae bacterium]
MNTTILNKEADIIKVIAGDFARYPLQVNSLLEADAEIIKLPGKDEYLVLKTDGIYEEIKQKLYEDPYLIGWMTVTAPISDIAAVGALPTGLLLSLVLPQHYNNEWLQQFKSGIKDACEVYKMYILGGDTNFDDTFSVSATAVAGIKSQKPLLRTGMKHGDNLYATASLGLGNAYAYYRLFNSSVKIKYQPVARLKESSVICKYATACMDTSDGLFPALSTFSELNEAGFNLTTPLDSLLHPDILPMQYNAGLPAWMFMAGPHGEYELLFTVPKTLHKKFELVCKDENWQPLLLGEVIAEEKLYFSSESLLVQCHPATIANLFYEVNGNIQSYFELLLQHHKT